MTRQRRTWRAKFRDSLRGVRYGLDNQSSFTVHVVAAVLAIALGLYLRISRLEWSVLTICIALVFATELLNTSIEWLAQAITDEHDPRIGKALDIASAAVLLIALAACAIGVLVFVPHLLHAVSAEALRPEP